MEAGYLLPIGALVAGIVFGLLKNKLLPSGKKSYAGWVGLFVIAAPLVGLLGASAMGDETLTWVFGIALMLMLPAIFLFALGAAIGGSFNRGKDAHRN